MMQRYTEYKDSGVDWLGEIPVGWELTKLGSCLSSFSEKNHPNLPLLSITRELGVIERDIENQNTNHNYIPDDLGSYKLLKKGQFGMNKMKAWQGSYGVSPFTGIVSPAYLIFDFTKKIEPTFFHAAIRSKLYVSFFGSASDGVRIGQWDLSKPRMKEIPLTLPPLPEQTAIAKFLDNKTAKIDKLVWIKRRQIELLAERKQILIQNAVTKGLNPNATMKDSGMKLNEIALPTHWYSRKCRFVFKFNKGLTITKEYLQETGIPCVNYGEIHSKYGFEVDPLKHELKCVDAAYMENNPSSLLEEGDFVFADTSEDIKGSGNFTYLNSREQVFAGYHTVIAKPIGKNSNRFLAYVFDSSSFRVQVRKSVKGVKVFSITQAILKDMMVWFPPLEEQTAIAKFLDDKTAKIDDATTIKQNQISKLNEYKTTLINAAVTGKIKVI